MNVLLFDDKLVVRKIMDTVQAEEIIRNNPQASALLLEIAHYAAHCIIGADESADQSMESIKQQLANLIQTKHNA